MGSLEAANFDEKMGIDIVRKALRAPATQIFKNAGTDSSVIINDILTTSEQDPEYGWDGYTGEMCNMFQRGIVDPKGHSYRPHRCQRRCIAPDHPRVRHHRDPLGDPRTSYGRYGWYGRYGRHGHDVKPIHQTTEKLFQHSIMSTLTGQATWMLNCF